MAVTPIDPPVGELPSSTTPVRFSVTNLVGLVIAVDHSDVDVTRPVELVFADGVFLYPYLGSTLIGNVFSILRQGGWAAFEEVNDIRVFEQPPTKVAALHNAPVTPTALYALSGDDTSVLVDRSGNARPLSLNTSSHALNIPSLLPAPATGQWGTGVTLSGGPNQLLATASNFVYGTTAMTIFGVVAVTNLRSSSARTLAGCGWWGAGHVDWVFKAVSDGAGGCKLRYLGPSGSQFDGTHDLPNAAWETVMLRRSANGHTVRLTVGPIGNTDTSTTQPDSFTATGSETFGLGWIPDGGTEGWQGGMVDFGFYPSEWADADYTAQRARVLGL